jgi:flagellar hook-associated protein 3 FlgL
MLQDLVDNTETVSTETVSAQILQLQNSLQASYEATSIMAKLTLTNYLSAG